MRLVLHLLLVAALGVVGCSSDNAASGAPSSGDAGSSGGSVSPTKSGFIGVVSHPTAVALVFANSVGADFFDGPGNSYERGCTREVVGACSVLLCDLTDGGSQEPPTGAPESAGAITIGGTTPTFSLTYDPGTMQYGSVSAVPTDAPLFAGGNAITFTAAGADVTGFADTVVAPSPLVITSPVLTSAFSIDTGKDLVFEWTGSSVGRVAFNVITTTSSGASAVASSFVSCQFDASALKGVIPTALLRNLTKTDATTTARLGTDHSSTKDVVGGDHSVHLAVGSAVTNADGKTTYAADSITIL